MAIKIPFVADVSDFLRGTRDLEDSLDDVADALDDITKAGDQVDTQVGADLTSVGKEADAAAEKVERSFKDAFHTVEAQGRTTGQRLRSDLNHVGGEGGAFADFKDEAKQNLAESVSSFQGDAQSAVDAAQSTFGGLISSLGPAGAIGAAVAGVGIGLARGLFQKAQEEAEALREAIGGIFDELRENQGSLSRAFQGDQMADLIRDSEKFAEVWGVDVTTAMRVFGQDFGTIMRGLTGDTRDVTAAQEVLTQAWADAEAAGQTYVDENGNVQLSNQDLAKTSSALSQALRRQAEAYRGGVTSTQAFAQSQRALSGNSQDAEQAVADAAAAGTAFVDVTQDSAAALDDENTELRENARLKGDATTATWDMKDATRAVGEALKENKNNLNTNTSQGRENARAVKEAVDAINGWADAQVAAGGGIVETNRKLKNQRDALVNQLAPAFGNSKARAREFIETLGGIPPRKDTKVTVDDKGTAKATQEKIDNIKSSGVPVPVHADMSDVDREIKNHFNGKTYTFNVAPRPGKAVAT